MNPEIPGVNTVMNAVMNTAMNAVMNTATNTATNAAVNTGLSDPSDYAGMPVADQFAVVTTELGRHLPRVQEAARMWRETARQLAEVSESLGRELESVAPHWQDATGTGLLARGLKRKQEIDAWLARITEHQPWRALDDLTRQLLLTEARMAGAMERAAVAAMSPATPMAPGCPCPVSGTGEDTGAHLTELDRYFQAAADAELRSSGLEAPWESVADPVSGDALSGGGMNGAAGMPSMSTGPVLTGGPGFGLTSGLPGAAAGSLPPGAVSLPGLLAVPPGAGFAGGRRGRGTGPAGAFDGSRPSSSRAGSGSLGDSSVAPGGGAGGSGGPGAEAGGPKQIERAAHPPQDTGPLPAPDAPEAPDQGSASASGAAAGAAGAGGFFPPMMMPPMMGMGGGGGRGSRLGAGARTVGGNEHPTRARANPTPGVPSRLRGSSGLADPAGNGFRSATVAGTPVGVPGRAPAEPLEHEMWEVAEPTSAAQLKTEAADTDSALRRAGNRAR